MEYMKLNAMTAWIDISISIQSAMPIWPGDPAYQIKRFVRMEDGNDMNVSQISCSVHLGTHVDAPYHYVAGGKTIETLLLDTLIGPTVVAAIPDVAQITAADLAALNLSTDTTRLLLKTNNSTLWQQGTTQFAEDFVALSADAAQWLVDHNIKLIGVDYLSVQGYHDGPATHQILLGADVIIVEGLNLSAVAPGSYELFCLPIKLVGSDGAPARAVLRPLP